MKRREFLQNAGLGASGLIISRNILNRENSYTPPIPVLIKPISHKDLIHKDGNLRIRIEVRNSSDGIFKDFIKSLKIKNAEAEEIKEYFFERTDSGEMIRLTPDPAVNGILLLVLKNSTSETKLSFKISSSPFRMSISELISESEIVFKQDETEVSVNYLLDKEISEIDPASAGIKNNADQFSFAVMADPQGGDPENGTRIKIHNTWVEESVKIVNEHENRPVFTLMDGDIVDGQGQMDDFNAMNRFFSKLKTPVLFEIGNHETRYNSQFGPGYNHGSLTNYYHAQKAINGSEYLLYSFNLGQWHFIVWPDPLRKGFFERHPHYFEWLEKDLKKNKSRPTIVFQHVPAHPIGIDPLTEYAEAPYIKRLFTDILSTHGNVKYVLSGHVHISLRAAIKTAVEYKGIQFLNLPAAGYRPRAFGEEDIYGGISEGVLFVHIDNQKAKLEFRNVMQDSYYFPERFRKFDPSEFPFWFNYRWELAPNKTFINGNFSKNFDGWKKRFVYMEDKEVSNLCEIHSLQELSGEKALYLYSRKREFDTGGQDRLPQTLNRIGQIISLEKGKSPLIQLKIKPGKHFDPESRNGIYIWLEGYEKSIKKVNITYSAGYHFWHLERNYSQHNNVPPARMELPCEKEKWYNLELNPWEDFSKTENLETEKLRNIDRLILNLGVWTINDGHNQAVDVWFSDIRLMLMDSLTERKSKISGRDIHKKEDKYMVWGGTKHIAGEHIVWRTDMNFYGK